MTARVSGADRPCTATSAEELTEPRVLDMVREGNPIYAWPFAQRHVWRKPRMPFAARLLERAPKAQAQEGSQLSGGSS